MRVIMLSEDAQQSIVDQYNNDKLPRDKIPLVKRNLYSGWPLLQVSLFTPLMRENELQYEHALGGGKCHFLHIGAFSLASLLMEIPGTVDICRSNGTLSDRKKVNLHYVSLFLDTFTIHHKTAGISISSESGSYGKKLRITCTEGDEMKLLQAFEDDPFRFALKNTKKHALRSTGGWENTHYTYTMIDNAMDTDVALFENGQIFVDLGKSMEEKVNDDATRDYFKELFKVKQFRQLCDAHPDIQGTVTQSIAPQNQPPSVLLSKINLMKSDRKSHSTADLVHSEDKTMKHHQKRWKPIVANIFFSFTGIGLVAVGSKMTVHVVDAALHNKKINFDKLLFWSHTTSEKNVEDTPTPPHKQKMDRRTKQ